MSSTIFEFIMYVINTTISFRKEYRYLYDAQKAALKAEFRLPPFYKKVYQPRTGGG